MKKAHELRDLPLEELESLEREKSEELMNMKIQLKMRQLDNPLQVREAAPRDRGHQDRDHREEGRPLGLGHRLRPLRRGAREK